MADGGWRVEEGAAIRIQATKYSLLSMHTTHRVADLGTVLQLSNQEIYFNWGHCHLADGPGSVLLSRGLSNSKDKACSQRTFYTTALACQLNPCCGHPGSWSAVRTTSKHGQRFIIPKHSICPSLSLAPRQFCLLSLSSTYLQPSP